MVATSTLKNKNSECISEGFDRRYDQSCIEDELDFWERCLSEPPVAGSVSSVLGVDAMSGVSGGVAGGGGGGGGYPYPREEERACVQLARLLEGCLSRAKRSTLHCAEVLVPETLTRRMARDVLRLAAGEPCGLRGCVLHVQLQLEAERGGRGGGGGGCCKRLERIVCDASVVPTFELTLVFKQDASAWPWPSLRDFFLIGTACFAPGFRHALKLSPGFRLIKRKLYSSSPAGTVVEEY